MNTSERIARWESKSGKYWAELYVDNTLGRHYSYEATGMTGSLGASDDDSAIMYMLARILPMVQPDANITPMRQVFPCINGRPQSQCYCDEQTCGPLTNDSDPLSME